VQCLAEFYRVVTRRLSEPMSPPDALAAVERFTRACYVLDLTPSVVLEACRGAGAHRVTVWDGLVWATAKLNRLNYVVTEDFEHGSSLEGVMFLNPFDRRFDLAMLTE
jgi:predicted nucleic acid-binding protein